MIKSIIKLIRIKQWVKNGFVIAPFVFALKFTDIEAIKNVLLAFGAFCFVSSFVYVMNDIIDRKKDALHPKKKFRPIASGKISVAFGSTIAGILLVACVVCLYLLNVPKTTYCLIAYVIINVFYSIRLKNMIIMDVLTIAVGFILRLYAGAYAVQTTISGFIFMTTLFLASFLGFTKRRSEFLRSNQTTRKVLKKYTGQMIDQFICITATLTIISYALYTMEPSTIDRLGTNRLIYTIFLVVYGIFRYFYILSKPTEAEDPTENLYKDKGMIAVCGLYVVCILVILMSGTLYDKLYILGGV